jgi:chemotaxis protein CheD
MSFVLDYFLQPGEVYFGDADTRIRTLLGSCVAVTWWHPTQHIGGMCHYLLPTRPQRDMTLPVPDGRYAEEAFGLALDYIQQAGTPPQDYQVKMFGGGDVLKHTGGSVGARNIAFARTWLAAHGFRVSHEHLAGHGFRNIIFDIATGDVWVRYQALDTLKPG